MQDTKMNLGCGRDIRKGYLNVDISDAVGAQKVMDIQKTPWDFADDQFDHIIVYNVLTQIASPQKFVEVMNELWRVTKDTGIIEIRVPNALHICAWQDPMDCRRFTDQSFTYMQHGHRRFEQYGRHYGFRPFRVDMVEDNKVQMVFLLMPFK